jgi:hypothetical protein
VLNKEYIFFLIFSWSRPRTNINEKEISIEQRDREQMNTAGGEGFVSALLRLLFQDCKQDTGIREYSVHKGEGLYTG